MIPSVTTKPRLLAASIVLALSGSPVGAFELEEIVVTAQKREQNLQDVPVSVSAFTGDQLKEAAIKDVFDLQANTPGLRANQSQSNGTSNFSIRGIGTSSQNFGLESSVGLYVDGVYRARQSTMINDMVDIEAVEVLRGPQGTLFGKNTPSGAVLFRTVAPSHETDAYASFTGGNLGLVTAQAAGNLSLIEDKLAVRGTVFSSERDGYVDAVGIGSDELNDRDRWGVRLQALYEPTEDLSIRLMADYSEIDETCCAAVTYVDNFTARNDPSRFGSDALLAQQDGTFIPEGDEEKLRTGISFLPSSKATDRGLSMDISWEQDNFTLTSVTSYRKYNSRDTFDGDFTDLSLFAVDNDAQQTTFTQELRLDFSGDQYTGVIGAYYFQQDIDLDYALTSGSHLNDFSANDPELAALIAGIEQVSLASGGIIGPAADPFPSDFVASHVAAQEQESWAIFGQFDFNLSDDLVLTAGLRYTEEEKTIHTVFNETIGGASWNHAGPIDTSATAIALGQFAAAVGPDPSNPDLAAIGALFSTPGYFDVYAPYQVAGWGGFTTAGFTPRDDIRAKLDDEQITGTLKLSWFVDSETLVYASYGTGYKSGGTNTDRIATGFDPVFDAETSESFELGIKTEFPEHALRLNAAIFHSTVDDFQANAFSGDGGFNLQNAGELKSQGGELEVLWQAAENTTVTFAYAYTKAEFEEFEEGNCWTATPFHTGISDPGANADGFSCDRSGDRVVDSPEHYANLGVKQEFVVSNSIDGYVYGEYVYLSDQVLDSNNDPLSVQDGYGLINARAGLFFTEVDVDVTLWARNLLDEYHRRTSFPPSLQTGKLMTFPGEPRTFGITLNKNF